MAINYHDDEDNQFGLWETTSRDSPLLSQMAHSAGSTTGTHGAARVNASMPEGDAL